MAAVSLFWNANMAAMTSCETTLFTWHRYLEVIITFSVQVKVLCRCFDQECSKPIVSVPLKAHCHVTFFENEINAVMFDFKVSSLLLRM